MVALPARCALPTFGHLLSQRRCHRLVGPSDELILVLEHFSRHGVVPHLHILEIGARPKPLATPRLVLRSRRIIRLEIQPLLVQQPKESAPAVQPQPAKHAARFEAPEALELPEQVVQILLADGHYRVERGSIQRAHARPRNSPSPPYKTVPASCLDPFD